MFHHHSIVKNNPHRPGTKWHYNGTMYDKKIPCKSPVTLDKGHDVYSDDLTPSHYKERLCEMWTYTNEVNWNYMYLQKNKAGVYVKHECPQWQ